MKFSLLHFGCRYWYPLVYVPTDSRVWRVPGAWRLLDWPFVREGRFWGVEWRRLMVTWP